MAYLHLSVAGVDQKGFWEDQTEMADIFSNFNLGSLISIPSEIV